MTSESTAYAKVVFYNGIIGYPTNFDAWKLPLEGWIKINSDARVTGDGVRVGFVIHDFEGMVSEFGVNGRKLHGALK